MDQSLRQRVWREAKEEVREATEALEKAEKALKEARQREEDARRNMFGASPDPDNHSQQKTPPDQQ